MIVLPTLTVPAPRARPPPSPPPLELASAVLPAIVTLFMSSTLDASPDQKIAPPLPSAELATKLELVMVAPAPLLVLENAPPSFVLVLPVKRLPLMVVTALVTATRTAPPAFAPVA